MVQVSPGHVQTFSSCYPSSIQTGGRSEVGSICMGYMGIGKLLALQLTIWAPLLSKGHPGYWQSVYARMAGSLACVENTGEFIENGELKQGLQAVEIMEKHGTSISRDIAYCLLKECFEKKDPGAGRQVESLVLRGGLDSIAILGDHLIRLFAYCGSLWEANRVFSRIANPSLFTWTAIISANANLGDGRGALELFDRMQPSFMNCNKHVYIALLKACAMREAIEQGRLLHYQIIRRALEDDVFVGNTLLDMYAKCKSLGEARKVFDDLQNRSLVSWVAMIGGYAQHGYSVLALELFEKMQEEGIKPERVAYLNALKACANVGAMDQAKQIHHQIIKYGLIEDVLIGSALVDMYVKCVNLEEARKVFDHMLNRNVVSWAAMIAGYANQGDSDLAGQCFDEMQREGIKPDDVIFSSMLAACSHAGRVDEGHQYFKSMKEAHNITADITHYTCMIDLFGRAGLLVEAEQLLQSMKADIIGWKTLLTACRTYGNVTIGRRSFDKVVQLDAHDAAAYVLMSNIYSDAQMWNEVSRIEEQRKCIGAWKKAAKAWIEINGKVHEFIVGDKSHPQSDEIHTLLKRLHKHMKDEGYVPELGLVFQTMSEEGKEDVLCGHCEKLAIAFGLLSSPQGAVIRITKNLRVCTDCHNAGKIVSKMKKREIVIRDVYRIHHFNNGACSCGDYI